MKIVQAFGIILLITFLSEALYTLLPLPIPASIYGLVILFLCLKFKIVRCESVKDTAHFLNEIMILMFVPVASGLMDSWDVIAPVWAQVLLIVIGSTFAVMFTAGRVSQFFLNKWEKQ